MLPGVGAFADCRRGLDAIPGMIETLQEAVAQEGPAVSRHLRRHAAHGGARARICKRRAASAGSAATSRRSGRQTPALKIPHMGWNTLQVGRNHPVLAGIPTGRDGLHAYFVHSYALYRRRAGRDSSPRPIMAARSWRSSGATISSAPSSIPEKSQKLGLALIANFLRWRP